MRLLSLTTLLLLIVPSAAQERVKPASAKGGKGFGEPWAQVPDAYKKSKIPEWPVPTDLAKWQKERLQVRATLVKCLGDLPPRPDPRKVVTLAKEDKGDYVYEQFEFFNGVDETVTGVLLVPKGIKKPVPAIILAHGHSGSTDVLCVNEKNGQCAGPTLARKGYVVAAIDSYFCGKRVGKGPAGGRETKPPGEEHSLFKYHLLMGRCLWGMMIRDQQCLIDYLETRPEVNAKQIGMSGMSMGCTTSWWTAALDERIASVVGVACFTRYTELLAHGNLRSHGMYYFVPGVMAHFDTEAIHALIAPRPHLELSGDEDQGAPVDGVMMLEKKLIPLYRLHGKETSFKSIIYEKTGHEYLPEMRVEMVRWFEKTLPVVRQNKDRPKDFTNSIGMKFVWIPPGHFMMGSPKEEKARRAVELQHKASLTKGFYMGVFTVTQEEWQAVMGNNPSEFEGEKKLPVERVSWEDCQEFLKKLRDKDKKPYRLPTEAEWEYACRAGTTTPFHFGDQLSSERANIVGAGKGPSRMKTTPVGTFPANAWGLHDMHGNVFQWCQDWYGDYPDHETVDPQGPKTGKGRVLRGGSYQDGPETCRSAFRAEMPPHIRSCRCGFRVCLSME